jgi:hypothetical protein
VVAPPGLRGAAGALHGNAAASTRLTYIYSLWQKGPGGRLKFLKWGVTSNLQGRYPQWYMRGKVLRVHGNGAPRREILDLERALVRRHPGPLNRELWRGLDAQ